MVFLAFQQALSMLKGKVCRYIVDREASVAGSNTNVLCKLSLSWTVPSPGEEQLGCSEQV